MNLTLENAYLYEGKLLDANRRLFHHYPLKVIKINGEWMVKDSYEVCMFVPEESDKFNTIYFDIVVKGNEV